MLVCVVLISGTWKGSSVLAQPVSQYDELTVLFIEKSLCLLEIKSWPMNSRSVYTYLCVFRLWYFIYNCFKQSSKEVLECVILQLCPETSC